MKETFNNGKDLMIDDILFEKVEFQGENGWRAFLCFCKHRSKTNDTNKHYQAFGTTKKEALDELIDIMTDHMQRIKDYLPKDN